MVFYLVYVDVAHVIQRYLTGTETNNCPYARMNSHEHETLSHVAPTWIIYRPWKNKNFLIKTTSLSSGWLCM